MKKNILAYFALASTSLFCACSAEDITKEKETPAQTNASPTEIMSFSSKEDFQQALEDFDPTQRGLTRASNSFLSADDLYENAHEEDSEAEKIGFLIPDEKYRSFLNKNLEIIVNDTLYRITKDGTFYARVENRSELQEAVRHVGDFKSIHADLKEFGNVKLKNTFGTWNNDSPNPIEDEDFFLDEDEDEDEDEVPQTRATAGSKELTREDVENFPTIGTVGVSIIDKVIRFSPGYFNHKPIQFKSNKKRKLYVALYRYDYGFGVSIGLDCKVMKKLWHGMKWGRMKHWDAGIYYGISSLIVRQKMKDPAFDNFMKEGKSLLKKQWETLKANQFGTYEAATKNFNGGIQGKWSTNFNGIPSQSKFVIPIIGEQITKLLGNNKPSATAAKMLDKFLVSKGIQFLSRLGTTKAGQQVSLFAENDKSIYNFFSNDITWNGGGYRVKETFLKYQRDVRVDFTYTPDTKITPKNVKGITISDNAFIGAPSILFCEGIVYTRDGDGWVGVKIMQNGTDGLIANTGK